MYPLTTGFSLTQKDKQLQISSLRDLLGDRISIINVTNTLNLTYFDLTLKGIKSSYYGVQWEILILCLDVILLRVSSIWMVAIAN